MDARQQSPSTARNREPILEALRSTLPPAARVLELASGTGEHAVFFAGAMPGWNWQPSDPDAAARASIEAWRQELALANLLAPLAIDARAPEWGVAGPFDAIVAINMIHISPWECTEALMRGAARLLDDGAPLVLYGPYHVGGKPTAPSNAAFDESLRMRDASWGVRHLEEVVRVAGEHGFAHEQTVPMPANNLTVVLRRTDTGMSR